MKTLKMIGVVCMLIVIGACTPSTVTNPANNNEPVNQLVSLNVNMPNKIMIDQTNEVTYQLLTERDISSANVIVTSQYVTIAGQQYDPLSKTGKIYLDVTYTTTNSFPITIDVQIPNDTVSTSVNMYMEHDTLIHFRYEIVAKTNFDEFPASGVLKNTKKIEVLRYPSKTQKWLNSMNYYSSVTNIFATPDAQESISEVTIKVVPYIWSDNDMVDLVSPCINTIETNITQSNPPGYNADPDNLTYPTYNWGSIIKSATANVNDKNVTMYIYTSAPLFMESFPVDYSISILTGYSASYYIAINYTDSDNEVKTTYTYFYVYYSPAKYETHLN